MLRDNVSESNRGRADFSPTSLTDVEIQSRRMRISLADGHAAQYDQPYWIETVRRLPEYEATAAGMLDREAEGLYVERFMELFRQPEGLGLNMKILPNASWAIDTVMTLAVRRQWRVALIEPAFDNLFLYARERGVPIVPVHEQRLRGDGVGALEGLDVDLLFLVTPNNPTGFTIQTAMLIEIAEWCARSRTTLAIDASFRAYDTTGADHYAILRDAGCSFVVIEDTGKTWPTRERKASIVSCSNDLKRDLNEICEIHVLGWSSPILVMLADLATRFTTIGLEHALWAPVRRNREIIRAAVGGTFVRPAAEAVESTLPLEWLEILDDRCDDHAVMRACAKRGLGVLPGRHFHWATLRSNAPVGSRFFRVSLLKDQQTIETGAALLRETLLTIATEG